MNFPAQAGFYPSRAANSSAPVRTLRDPAQRSTQTIQEIIMPNPVVHWELMTKNPAKVSEFYKKVFDWKIQHMPDMDYWMVDTGAQGAGNASGNAGINGGILDPKREGPWPGNTCLYVAVDNLADYRKAVVAAGGEILVEEQPVPGMGSFSLFKDPDGRMMGLWKNATA
jgi:predicted enzyme related to lactoylglutathione lyase